VVMGSFPPGPPRGPFPPAPDPRRPDPRRPAPPAPGNPPGYEFDERRGKPRIRLGRPATRDLGFDLDDPPGGRHRRPSRLGFGRSGFGRSGRALRVAVPVTVVTLGVASGLIVSVNSSAHRAPASSGSSPGTAAGFPPATLAGQDFTPYAAGSTRGVTLSEGRVTSAGAEIVAVGAETGQLVPRAQFFVSADDGRSWALGRMTTAGGGTPPPGHAARFVAGGAGEWAAVGPDSVWTSADGRAWTLASATGLPQQAGDQVAVLKRTASGFIAAGANMPGRDQATPVIFLSTNGRNWQRFGAFGASGASGAFGVFGARRLRLAAGAGRALDIRLAATYGRLILIAGDVATEAGGSLARTGGAWLSHDGGRSWTPVTVPTGHGAQDQFSDEAATADGFLLVRPATVDGAPAADMYRSGNGTTWTFAATVTARGGFAPSLMNGDANGAVLTGQSGRTLAAFVSRDGVSWRQAAAFGTAAETISGVAEAGTGAVVAAGTGAASQLITVGGGAGGVRNVSLADIPGGAEPQLAVNAVAAQGSQQVVVGSANGFPAAWMSADGGHAWHRATGLTPAVLTRPGIQQLTGVTHGSAGWLAVGGGTGATGGGGITGLIGVTGSAAGHPVVIGSADGSVWSAADGESVFTGSGLVTAQAAADSDCYVIVGSQLVTAPSGQLVTIAAAWWSAGLTGWQRAGDAAAGALDGAGSRQMLAVTATADGFVAVGSHGRLPAAWTTPDGKTWILADLPLPAGATEAVLQHVAASGRTVAAVGVAQTAAGQVPFAARSADGGRTWTEAALPVPAGTAQVSALAAAGGGFTATGTFGVTPGDRDVVVWTSPDGTTWQAATPAGPGLAAPGIQAITGLAVSGRTLTGVGFTATPAGEQPTLWQPPIK